MSSTFSILDPAKLNLSTQTRARLSMLALLLQKPAEGVIDQAVDALLETLSETDQHMVTEFQSRFPPFEGKREDQTGSRLADQIRAFVEAEYVRPAREKREKRLTVRVKEVHRRMGLIQRYPAVVSALQAKVFLEDCRLRLVESSGAKQGSTKVIVFELL